MCASAPRWWCRLLFALPAAALLHGAQALGQGDEPSEGALRVVVSSGVRGHLADADCDADVSLEPSAFARAAARIVPSLDRVPLGFAFDSGGLVSPHGVARFALSETPSELAALVEALGYRALALGEDDLRAPPEDWVAFARALRDRSIPVVASNLVCEEPMASFCEALVTAKDGVPLFRYGGMKVAFLAYVSPRALDHLGHDHASALTVLPIEASVKRGVTRARELGADVIVASIDDGVGAEAFGRALSIASKLDADARPDFIVSARGGSEVMFARPMTQEPPVIAAPSGGIAQLDLRRAEGSREVDLRARMLAPASAPAEPIVRWTEALAPRYCEAWGSALPGGALARPIDAEGLRTLAAAVAKSATRADLVVLPNEVADPDFAQMEERHLARGDVEVGLRADAPLVVADVEGKWLKALAKSADAKKALFAPGLEVKDAGRPGERVTLFDATVQDEGVFRVVTIKPLAARGAPLPPGPKFRPTSSSLRAALLEHLGAEREDDPREAIVDPAGRVEWYGRLMADANFGGTVVRNPGGYEESQLDRVDSLAFGVTSQSDFGAVSREFGWENRFDLRYRIIRDEAQGTVEGDDFISLISRAKWLGLRAENPKVYVPEPFAEVYVESEFTQGAARDYHHLFVRPTFGAIFRLMEPVLFSMRAGFQFEALDPERVVEPGYGVRLEATNLEILKEGETKVLLRGFVDYFWSSLGRRNTHTLRSTVDVSFALGKRFGVGVLVVVFGMKDEGGPFSVATNATAFLRASFYGRRR